MQTQQQAAADPETKLTDLGCESASTLLYTTVRIRYCHILIITQPETKADTHFTVPWRVEGCVEALQ